jgi:hypothetical protein
MLIARLNQRRIGCAEQTRSNVLRHLATYLRVSAGRVRRTLIVMASLRGRFWGPRSLREEDTAHLWRLPLAAKDEQVNSLFSQLSDAESMTEVSDWDGSPDCQPLRPALCGAQELQGSCSDQQDMRQSRRHNTARTWTNPIAEDEIVRSAGPFYGDVDSNYEDSCTIHLRECINSTAYHPLSSQVPPPPDLAAQLVDHRACNSPTHSGRTDMKTAGGTITSFMQPGSPSKIQEAAVPGNQQQYVPGPSNPLTGHSNGLANSQSVELLCNQNETLRQRIAAMEAIINNSSKAATNTGRTAPMQLCLQAPQPMGMQLQQMQSFARPVHTGIGMAPMGHMSCSAPVMQGV